MSRTLAGSNRTQKLRRACLLASLLCATTKAHADAFQSLANQRNMLPGGQGALMGGAFSAVASDSSASFYNPAGLANIKQNRYDLSATSYGTSEIIYNDAVNNEPFNEHSEVTYPSFVGATEHFDWLSIGYSYMTLDAHNIYQQDKYSGISTAPGGPNVYSRTYQESSSYILGGGSAAIKFSESFSLGSSAFYYQRNLQYSAFEQIEMNGGGILAMNSTMNTLNAGVRGVFGVLWQKPLFSLALTAHQSESMSDRSTMDTDLVTYDPDNPGTNDDGKPIPTVVTTRRRAKELNELNPKTYVLGTAFHPTSWLLLSGDLLLHEGVQSKYKSEGGADLETTVNYSVGMHLKMGPVSLLGGSFSNKSMYRAPSSDRSNQPLHIDFYGTTYGIGFDFGGFTGYVGSIRQVGKGESQIRNGDPSIQSVDGVFQTYTVAGNISM